MTLYIGDIRNDLLKLTERAGLLWDADLSPKHKAAWQILNNAVAALDELEQSK